MTPTFRRIAPLLALLLLAPVACDPRTAPADEEHVETPEQADPEDDRLEDLLEEAEAAWSNRGDKAEATRAIELWEKVADEADDELTDDDLVTLYESIARAHYFIARFHLADGPDITADTDLGDTLDDGLDAASRALEITAPDFRRAVDVGAPFEADFPEFDDEAATALLWYGKHLHLRAKTGNESTAQSLNPVVDTIMERVAELNPEAHFGAAHRYWGTRHIDRLFNRNPEASLQAFETSLDSAPDYLLTRVLLAVHLKTFHDDRDGFQTELRTVINTDDEELLALPENAIARGWASRLLKRTDELFD